MSSQKSVKSKSHIQPAWFWDLIDIPTQKNNDSFESSDQKFQVINDIPRAEQLLTSTQSQTRDAFSYVWSDKNRFESDESLSFLREWYKENYGDLTNAEWWNEYHDTPLVLEAGCGSGISGSQTFLTRINNVKYLGVDVSDAIDRAAERFAKFGYQAAFMQTDLMQLPFDEATFDVIYSQGVLHHTDSTEAAIKYLATLLKPGGRILFYVYRKKGPIREYTDDYIREKLQSMNGDQGWEAIMPLTRFGEMLGKLDIDIDVPEDIDLLEIPAGRISLQRFFYWHIFKAFYREEMPIEEMAHINYDWYAPKNAHRQTPEEVREWCSDVNLVIEREHIQEAGISVVAKKEG